MVQRLFRQLQRDVQAGLRSVQAQQDLLRAKQRRSLGRSDETPLGWRSRAESAYFIR